MRFDEADAGVVEVEARGAGACKCTFCGTNLPRLPALLPEEGETGWCSRRRVADGRALPAGRACLPGRRRGARAPVAPVRAVRHRRRPLRLPNNTVNLVSGCREPTASPGTSSQPYSEGADVAAILGRWEHFPHHVDLARRSVRHPPTPDEPRKQVRSAVRIKTSASPMWRSRMISACQWSV